MTIFSVTSATLQSPINHSHLPRPSMRESHIMTYVGAEEAYYIQTFFSHPPFTKNVKVLCSEPQKRKCRLLTITGLGDSTRQESGRTGTAGTGWGHQSGLPHPADINTNNMGHVEGPTLGSPTFKSHKGLTTQNSPSLTSIAGTHYLQQSYTSWPRKQKAPHNTTLAGV